MSLKHGMFQKHEEEPQLLSQVDSGSPETETLQNSKGLPWLRFGRRANLEIDADAHDMLRKEHSYIGMVMVCGIVRSGKSYLMNALLDRQVFGVSDRATSFTLGVDICPDLLPISQIGGQVSATSPKLAFVDLEGQGDKGMKQDLRLAAPILMISKVVILNEICPAGPAKEVILEKLKVMMHAAQCITNRRDRRAIFGCLHIVLRDCPQDEQECQQIIFDAEDPLLAETDEQEEAMNTRNDIRTTIKVACESFKVWCLPKIMSKVAPLHYRDAPQAYVEKIDALRQDIAKQLAIPKVLDGNALTGSRIATLLPQIAEAMQNEQPALSPPSLMEHVLHAEAIKLADELMKRARSKLQGIKNRLPMDPDELAQQTTAIQNRLAEELDGPSRQKAGVLFNEMFTDEKAELRIRNSEQLAKLALEVEQDINAKVEALLQAFELPMEPDKLKIEHKHAQGCLNEELTDRLRIVPAADAEAAQRRIAEIATRVEKELRTRNVELFMSKLEREVIDNVQTQLELLKLPQSTDQLNICIRAIDRDAIGKLEGHSHMVSASTLEAVRQKVLDSFRLIEGSVLARNAVKLSEWAREAEASHEAQAREQLEALALPLEVEHLRRSFTLVRSSSHENLEERLRIVPHEEANNVRQRATSKMQLLEDGIVIRNSNCLRQRARETEEDLIMKFKFAIEALKLPFSEKRLRQRVTSIRKDLLKDLDLSIYPSKEEQEIRQRIERKFEALELEVSIVNSTQLWRHRRRNVFEKLLIFSFLGLLALLADAMGIIPWASLSYALNIGLAGTKHALLAIVWDSRASVTELQGKLDANDGALAEHKHSSGKHQEFVQEVEEAWQSLQQDTRVHADHPTEDTTMEKADIEVEAMRRRWARQEVKQAWRDTEDEVLARAKRWNSRELLRWLPYSTGVGVILISSLRWGLGGSR